MTCFICGLVPSPPKGHDHTGQLEESLQTVFLLRHVLDLPSLFLEGVLLRHGHPSEWVFLCAQCGEEVGKGRDLFLEIHRLQKDLSTLRNVIRDKVMVKREPGSETEEVGEAAIEIKDFLWGTYDNADEDGIGNESPNPSLLEAVLNQQENDFPQLLEDFEHYFVKVGGKCKKKKVQPKPRTNKHKTKPIGQYKKRRRGDHSKRKAKVIAVADAEAEENETTPSSSGRECRMKQRTASPSIPSLSDLPRNTEEKKETQTTSSSARRGCRVKRRPDFLSTSEFSSFFPRKKEFQGTNSDSAIKNSDSDKFIPKRKSGSAREDSMIEQTADHLNLSERDGDTGDIGPDHGRDPLAIEIVEDETEGTEVIAGGGEEEEDIDINYSPASNASSSGGSEKVETKRVSSKTKGKRGRPRKYPKIEKTADDLIDCDASDSGPDPDHDPLAIATDEDETEGTNVKAGGEEEEDIDMNYSPSNASSSGGSEKVKAKCASSKTKEKSRKVRSPKRKGENGKTKKERKRYKKLKLCSLCPETLNNLDEYEDHFRSSHVAPASLTCSGCEVVFIPRDSFSAHIQEGGCGGLALPCDNKYCLVQNLVFSSKEALNIHKKVGHGRKTPIWPIRKDEDGETKKKKKKSRNGRKPCSLCPETFKNLDEYEDHYRSSHVVPASLTCSGCEAVFIPRDNFFAHIQEGGCGGQTFPCDNDNCHVPKLIFSSEEALNIHKKVAHEKKPSIWPNKLFCFCGFACTFESSLSNHFADVHLYSLYDFEKDDPPVEDLSLLSSPVGWKDIVSFCIFKMKEFHRQTFEMSKNSSAPLTTKGLLRKRELAKSDGETVLASLPSLLSKYGVTSVPCSFCHSNDFKDLEELSKHTETCEANPSLKCEQCFKPVKNKRFLEQHIRVSHTEKADLACKGCGKVFINITEYGTHIRKSIPQNDDANLCKKNSILCDEPNCRGQSVYLNSDVAMNLHLTTRHLLQEPEKEFYCMFYKDCGQSFSSMLLLKRHLASDHRNEEDSQKVVCHLCGTLLSHMESMREHLKKSHKALEPGAPRYPCEICGKEMISMDKLRRHKQIHIPLEEAPHLCTLCGKRFRLREYLVIHTRSHDPDRREKYSSYKPRKKRPPGYVNLGVTGLRRGRPPKESSDFNKELY